MYLNESLWENGYLSGEKDRIFINTSLGCSASCEYCYLPQIGYRNGREPDVYMSADRIIEEVICSSNFNQGKHGSIISIGCFSECWSEKNKKHIKKVISYFISQGNPVQMSTKMLITSDELSDIAGDIKWRGQFTIFISCATIKHWNIYEKGTIVPAVRFKSFELIDKLGIPMYLYIKPVIRDVTKQDIKNFIDLMEKYEINAIVGSNFDTKNITDHQSPISKKLHYNYTRDEDEIYDELVQHGHVYRRSIDPVNKWRLIL